MNDVYIMVPLAQIATSSLPLLERFVADMLHMDAGCFKLHQLKQMESSKKSQEALKGRSFCVKVEQFKLSFLQMDSIIKQWQSLQSKIQILEETLESYSEENRQPANSLETISQSMHIDQIIKKAKKAKELKQENKKLKKLLQVQLENTEKVREQTQKTMKNLKEEFDALVNQMTQKQNMDRGAKVVRSLQPYGDN